ncbi:MAG TPA: ATP-binding protein [Trebonia sp.]
MMMLLRYAPPGGAPSTDAPRGSRVRQVQQLTLAPQPAVMPQSRQAVRETLRAWKLDTVADTVVLLASELLSNAVQATSAAVSAPGGEQLTLTLRRTGPGVLVEVWDPNPAPAIPQDPGLTDECGRGLLLVETLSSTWGQRTASSGKIVWCEITLASADGQALD